MFARACGQVVTPIAYRDGDHTFVEPSEWMDKEEVGFEATATDFSPFFRVPDEVVIRVRKHVFDDGYEGAKVDMRSRGHLHDDHGSNVFRIRKFVEHNDFW